MFKNYVVNLVCSGGHLTTWNSPHEIHHMMFKRRGEGGVKGFLNNVKKNCTFLTGWLPSITYEKKPVTMFYLINQKLGHLERAYITFILEACINIFWRQNCQKEEMWGCHLFHSVSMLPHLPWAQHHPLHLQRSPNFFVKRNKTVGWH